MLSRMFIIFLICICGGKGFITNTVFKALIKGRRRKSDLNDQSNVAAEDTATTSSAAKFCCSQVLLHWW